MLKRVFYVIFSVVFLISHLNAQDEEKEVVELTLPSGKVVVLDQDYETWEYKVGGTTRELSEDRSITLQDNRIILLKKDYTYEFVTKKELKERQEETVSVKSAHGEGSASDIDVRRAKAKAMKTVVKELTDDIYRALKAKPKYSRLKDCVRRLKKDVKSDEKFVKGKGWTVKLRVDLGEMGVATVVECAREKKGNKEKSK